MQHDEKNKTRGRATRRADKREYAPMRYRQVPIEDRLGVISPICSENRRVEEEIPEKKG
jgi:hypothetical protein